MITGIRELPVYPPGTIVQVKLSQSVTMNSWNAIGYRNPFSPWLDSTMTVEMAFLNDFKGIVLESVDVKNSVEDVSEVYKTLPHLLSYRVRIGEKSFWFRWTEVERIQGESIPTK